ncbi:MAG TPA: primosomal protein N' [Alphaproteobacteria bacterium]|nr:primosomal protein N' [Alphaproteobacteria bacterium]
MENTIRAAVMGAERRLAVLLPLPLSGAYDYAIPDGIEPASGDFLRVPLGSREVIGVAWGEATGEVGSHRLKPILGRLDAPLMPEVMRRFVEWVAHYTLSPPGAVLRMAMSVSAALESPKAQIAYRRAAGEPEALGLRLTPGRARVLAILADGPPRHPLELAREAGVSPAVVKSLAQSGVIEQVELPARTPFDVPDISRAGVAHTPDQLIAVDALRARVEAGGYSVTLLDGVAGSGKTEVYFEAIAATLAAGRQALVLVPEIALTSQWLARFRNRFGVEPAQWHSDLSASQRRITWRAIAEGRVQVLVGARSALFLPFPRLGLIVVDEEHDHSFKQEDGVIYHARDMAVVRARLGDHPIVLASATPSLETIENVRQGRYSIVKLPDRHGGAVLPEIKLIDMRLDPPPRQSWLSPTLRAALAETLEAKEQAMLFLNRRGYAPLTLCRSCGHRMQCPQCTAWLVEHRLAGKLQCHHCGFSTILPAACPACHAPANFAACGPGVERLAEEFRSLHPDARVAIVASDTLGGPEAIAELVRQVAEHEIDVLIGTQIVAKGHHFPMLTLVGVVDADLGLDGGELRAAERTYQLLAQVAGRAGRAMLPGRVFLQTYRAEHPVMQALIGSDREGFLAAEAEARQRGGWPPFGRLAALIVSGPYEDTVDRTARALARKAPHGEGIEVLGPAPAPLALLRGRFRRRLLLKTRRGANIQAYLRRWLDSVEVPSSVRVQVDIDPYSFL